MSQIVAANAAVLSQINSARSFLNSPLSFRLYQNDVFPAPNTLLSHLIEASFPGYSRLATTGMFPEAFKVVDGRYECDSTPFALTCLDDTTQTIYGWSISLAGTLYYAARFDLPIPALLDTAFSVVVSLQETAMVLCQC